MWQHQFFIFEDFKVCFSSFISEFSWTSDFDAAGVLMICENKLSACGAPAFVYDFGRFQSHDCYYNV